ncbi:MAG: hypothetical protein ACTMKU_08880, partial [Actinomycetaceae bacterium]
MPTPRSSPPTAVAATVIHRRLFFCAGADGAWGAGAWYIGGPDGNGWFIGLSFGGRETPATTGTGTGTGTGT